MLRMKLNIYIKIIYLKHILRTHNTATFAVKDLMTRSLQSQPVLTGHSREIYFTCIRIFKYKTESLLLIECV